MKQSTTQVPRAPLGRFVVTGAGMTHRGCVRDNNEDMILTDPEGIIWAVADGLGGHGNGEMASRLVVDMLSNIQSVGTLPDQIEATLMEANASLVARGGSMIMGSTVVVACFEAGRLDILWAGDSRLYRFRNGKLSQLTSDHSVVEDLVASGALKRADIVDHPEAHVLTQAIGAAPTVEIARIEVELLNGDRFLLCSDGLSGVLSEDEIAHHLLLNDEEELAVRALMTAALDAGAPDNVSAIVTVAHAA